MATSTALQVLVSPFLGSVFEGLRSLVENEFRLISEANDEFQRLSGILSTIEAVIEDAEEKQLTDKPILNWLKKLKNVIYDVEDFLDECNTDAALRNSPNILEPSSRRNNIKEFMTGSVPSFFCFQPSSSSRRTIAERVQSFIHRFDEIAKQGSQFHFNQTVVTAADVRLGSRQLRETSSYTDEPEVYGREEDIELIVNLLKNDASGIGNDRQGRDVSVVAIVGMGGLGKTTLVQKVYHDERIKDHFGVKYWICVSEDFSPTRFIKIILQSLGEEVSQDQQTLEFLQSRLQEKLSGKKFLVVLDDVWSENQGKWETLKTSLSCGAKGSFIVVTTRLKTVASIMATLPPYYPGILSEEDCWNLFKQRAFNCGEEKDYPELEAVGREIVKKCGGIPLAAKALGGLLRFKREEKQWLNVKESEIWKLPVQGADASDAILPALQLSYKHLSSQSKLCFAYCSIYPKDFLMRKEELIFMWMANGFIKSEGGLMEFEDIGNEIFNDLSWRSFFQDVEKDEKGNTISCKMHDLMHDLARSVMVDECLYKDGGYGEANIQNTTRYVSLNNMAPFDKYSFLKTMVHIREFRLDFRLCPGLNNLSTLLRSIFSNLKCLRVLNFKLVPISKIPESIGSLKHLRYLNLSHTQIRSLPNELCSLINLQILNLCECYNLKYLAPDMRKMTNLRHLNISCCDLLTKMPIEMGKLIFLRTLSMFVVGKESGRGISELKDLQHLKGELWISGLEHVKSAADARNANLIQKKHLQSLVLYWHFRSLDLFRGSDTEEEKQAQLMVGEGLQPHQNLKRLNISGYGGVRFPHWIGVGVSSCLPNLVQITLSKCRNCEHLPLLGELPLLRYLRLFNFKSVKCISEFYHHGDQGIPFFPSLEELYMHEMYHFGEISSPSSLSRSSSSQSLSSNQAQVSSFPRLRILEIRHCPELASFISFPPSLEELVLENTHEELLLRYLKQSPSSLSSLEIAEFPNLTHLSVQNNGSRHLANLRELKIWNCAELQFSRDDDADFQNLISLRSLELRGLNKMTYFPSLPLLTSLSISKCSGLATLEEWTPNLTSLQSLAIKGCENLDSLSDGLQQLTGLTRLNVEGCKNLKSLPDEGLERLTALTYLSIEHCHPDLHRKYRNKEGPYWDKISHIPKIRIGRPQVN